MWRGSLVLLGVVLALVMATATAGASPPPLDPTLKVPSQFPTIQSAINAATSGDTILVAPGTYVEQLTIDKSVTITGSGIGTTIVQSPAVLAPDAFGNPWTIELGNAATVTLSGFTLLVTLQCIISMPAAHAPILFAGGGIGVGGSAILNLSSAAVTTAGGTEGAKCRGPSPGTAGFLSFGTGVDFGLDTVTGSPPANELIGTGTISGATISGFGFGGDDVAIGGLADSPAGSSALLTHDQMATSLDFNFNTDFSGGGAGGAAIRARPGNSASVVDNLIMAGPFGVAIEVIGSSASITSNTITGSTSTTSEFAVVLFDSSATISFNQITNFECEFNATFMAQGLCGPNFAKQIGIFGIFDILPAPGTSIEHNMVSHTDTGIGLVGNCVVGCVVTDNELIDNVDYGLTGVNGNITFLRNLVVGGLYGVASIAFSVSTAVTLSNVLIVNPSVAPFYFEVDCKRCTAKIVGT